MRQTNTQPSRSIATDSQGEDGRGLALGINARHLSSRFGEGGAIENLHSRSGPNGS